MKEISNIKPTKFNGIAFVVAHPTEDETTYNKPFASAQMSIFKNLLTSAGIDVTQCYWGHLSRLPILHPMEPSKSIYLGELKRQLNELNPNVVVLLGADVLKVAGSVLSVDDIRGTVFNCNDTLSPFYNHKCFATINPRDLIAQAELIPIARLDAEKIKRHGTTKDLLYPKEVIEVALNSQQIAEKLRDIVKNKTTIALDIEGDVNNVTCLSIATSSSYAFAIPLSTMSSEDEAFLVRELHAVFSDSSVKKILQNSLYDNFALSWRYNLLIRNVWWDTMLSGWEIYPELKKNLGHQLSIWTDRPAHKHERKIPDWHTHLEYCCKDSLGTYELHEKHLQYFQSNPAAHEHFRFNMELLPVLLYMQLHGMPYDKDKAKQYHERFAEQQSRLQTVIDSAAKRSININSPKQLNELLYSPHPKGFGFKKQHPKKGRTKDVTRLTSNVDAILELQKIYDDYPILDQILAWRSLEKLQQATSISVDNDNRIRCEYNLVGTDTGRLACYESKTGSGTNLQTITKKLRCLYTPDEDHYFFQCDLSGADGWTVAARCAQLGDPTMLDDYYFGIKPAKVIGLLYLHGAVVNTWSREEIKHASRDIGLGDTEWLYFAGKRAQHGTNYLLGPQTMSGQILKDSYKYIHKAIIVKPKVCEELQRLYRLRYPGVKRWQDDVSRQIYNTGTLPSASGHVRRFFGRRQDNSTIQSAVSHEPQANTTYVTNRAMLNLWKHPRNRNPDGTLIIQPLHQVHDAINGQFPKSLVDSSVSIIRECFDFPISIGQISLKIPFEGFYGNSWGDCDENHGTPAGKI